MQNLNFLPISDQQASLRGLRKLAARNILIALSLAAIVATLLLLAGRQYLRMQLREIETQESSASVGQQPFDEQIREVNRLLGDIEEIQAAHFSWSTLLIETAKLVPEGNRLSELSIDGRSGGFTLRGLSQTRADLLELEAGLKNSPVFEEIKSPLSNLLKPTAINFEFSGKVKGLAQEEDDPETGVAE